MSNNSGLDIKIKSDSSYIFSKSIKVSSLDIQAFKQYIDYNIASNPLIYTSFLDASIISIDGVFKIIEEDSIAYRRESTLVQMKNGSLKFSLIGVHNE